MVSGAEVTAKPQSNTIWKDEGARAMQCPGDLHLAILEKSLFIDCPMLEAAIGDKVDGFVLRAGDANRQPAPPLTDELEEQEVRDIHYHKPQRIGELLFNDWD